jgi:lia operon protein LiaG
MQKKTGILIVVAGVLLLLFTMNPMNIFSDVQFGFSFDTKKINEEKIVAADDFRDLTLQTGSTDIEVTKGNSDEIKVRLNGKVSSKNVDQVKLKVEPNGDTLVIGVDVPDGIQFGIRILDIDLSVELPEKQWTAANIESGSGNIELGNIHGETVSVKAGSGNIDVQDVMAGSLTVHTGSGNVMAEEIEAESIALESGSGNITAERYHATTLNFQTGSGYVELKDGESAVQGKAGSGNIRLESERLIYDTDLQAGSGNVTIDLVQEPSSLEVDYQGKYGNGKIQWDGIRYEVKDEGRLKGTFGSGDAVLKVRTGSGNFKLE